MSRNQTPMLLTLTRRWELILIYALLFVAFCFLLYYYREAYLTIRDTLLFFNNRKRVGAFISSYGTWAPVVFMGIQTLQVLVAPIPGELTGFIGGYLFGTGQGFAISTIGLTIGSCLAFLIARRFGMPVVRRVISQENMSRFQYLMEHKGAFFAFILFLIPGVPKDYLCYLLGLTPMHALSFLIVSTVGRIPGTLLLTMQGQAVQSERYRYFFVLLGIGLLLLVLALIYRGRIKNWLCQSHHLPRS